MGDRCRERKVRKMERGKRVYRYIDIYIFLIKIYSKAICKKRGAGRRKRKVNAEYTDRRRRSCVFRILRCNFCETNKINSKTDNSFLAFLFNTTMSSNLALPSRQILLEDACNKPRMSTSGESISLSTDFEK